ncbi:MAG: SUMF1/EgtB/PvdO family nonheme iron enzyme, partial [Nitrospira sp.]|nr:SUMF1/EgtB/PvdO family nonheme iron enzyme [Nitrospira sp.]
YQQGDVEGLGEGWRNPVRAVTIQPFAMGTHEVTFHEYDKFAIATNRRLPEDQGWGRGQRPVINVTWEDATAYAAWLAEATGESYRLPTESEWEYAARSGEKQQVWAGPSEESQLGDYAVYASNSGNRTAEVGSKAANGLGLKDLSGNVWEWMEDCWHEHYQGAPSDGSGWGDAGGGDCGLRVVRGGSWGNNPGFLRSSLRGRDTTDNRNDLLGFRLAQGTR